MEVLLSCYLDGELTPVQAQQVSEHLAQCSSCAQEYRTLKKNQMTLSSLSRKEVPAHVWPAIQHRVATEARVVPLRSERWRSVQRVALAAACVAIVLFFSIAALGYYSPESPVADASPANQVSQRNFMDGHAQFIGEDVPLSDKAAWAYVRSHQALQAALGEENATP
jgi:anti-sigma factor RsiW